jgi:hypothetical protein
MNSELTPIEAAARVLNEAFALDRDAIQCLLCVRIPVTQELADHPTVLVSKEGTDRDSARYSVSALGLFNAALQAATGMRLATKWSDEKDSEGRSRLEGFQVYDPTPQNGIAVLPAP